MHTWALTWYTSICDESGRVHLGEYLCLSAERGKSGAGEEVLLAQQFYSICADY